MSDYISRDSVLDLTARKNSIWDKITDSSGRGLTEIVNSVSSADVVEVVRCRDCIYYISADTDVGTFRDCITGMGLVTPNEDDFCPYGVRRSDDGKEE